ncbi:hypothetical protein CA54_60610 [Symmachiella macrocystis]|uniref:Uncharacterized protein n=1 Tax=Symmachiella macrocystis TaxID=2527985 RepID=A0A5C6AYE8_9PLAN|nr:hypothetical protein [Symmachiella macrocystis]TWU04179.1 hypothetical protein CA54_60610 [Symmachiella macrocystis]
MYKYTFAPQVDMLEIEASFLLAVLATESLHGESQVRLEAKHAMDVDRRTCVIDAGNLVGRDLNSLFVKFVGREFGEDAFTVREVPVS